MTIAGVASAFPDNKYDQRILLAALQRHWGPRVDNPVFMERLQALSLEVERVSFWRGGQVVFGWLHGMVGILPGHPDLYDAIRRPAARQQQQSRGRRVLSLALGTLLTPVAVLAAAIEIALRSGGTVYVEARRV